MIRDLKFRTSGRVAQATELLDSGIMVTVSAFDDELFTVGCKYQVTVADINTGDLAKLTDQTSAQVNEILEGNL
jgi:hypothetical protein